MGFVLVTCNCFLCDFRVHLLNFVNLSSLLLALSSLDDDKRVVFSWGFFDSNYSWQIYFCLFLFFFFHEATDLLSVC